MTNVEITVEQIEAPNAYEIQQGHTHRVVTAYANGNNSYVNCRGKASGACGFEREDGK